MPRDNDSDAFMDAAEAAAIQSAIDGTQHEIFNAGFGKEDDDGVIDDTGDRSLESMGEGLEGDHVVAEEDDAGDEDQGDEGAPKPEQVDAKPGEEEPGKTEQEPQPDQPRVPGFRLREANERARKAEAEVATLKGQLGELSGKLDGLIAGLSRGQKPGEADQKPETPAKPTRPDIFDAPTEFVASIDRTFDERDARLLQALANQRVETSMQIAAGRHGEAFDKAFEALGKLDPQNPEHVVQVQRIYRSPNPGESLVGWHRRNEALAQIGDDPAAYEARVTEKLRNDPAFVESVIKAARAQAEGNGSPNTTVRLPPSLNRARGGNARDSMDGISDFDDQVGIFNSGFGAR